MFDPIGPVPDWARSLGMAGKAKWLLMAMGGEIVIDPPVVFAFLVFRFLSRHCYKRFEGMETHSSQQVSRIEK